MPKISNKHAELTVIVDAIGAQGDGVADEPSGRYFIPFAAPGDKLSISPGKRRGDGVEASVKDIVEPSPDRTAPMCRHFESCGGCTLQHVTPQRIAIEKQAMLRQALSRRGLDGVPIAETITVAPGSRRRARFVVHRGLKPALGFRRRRSRMVLDITECPVLRPSIVAIIASLRTLVREISSLGASAEISITASDAGLDVLFLPTKRTNLSYNERELLANFATEHNLARLSWDDGAGPEPVAARRDAALIFGDATIPTSPGGFLQPTVEGEAAIARLAGEAIASAGGKRCADLFSGCGALGFTLLGAGRSIRAIHAFEGDAAMVDAARTARNLPKGTSLTAEVRDLARAPLDAATLNRFDAVIFDPPRAGADAQSGELAQSTVPTIIAVSCNPATLARDLRTMVNGGYRIEMVTPIDQFSWSPHIEAVTVLRR